MEFLLKYRSYREKIIIKCIFCRYNNQGKLSTHGQSIARTQSYNFKQLMSTKRLYATQVMLYTYKLMTTVDWLPKRWVWIPLPVLFEKRVNPIKDVYHMGERLLNQKKFCVQPSGQICLLKHSNLFWVVDMHISVFTGQWNAINKLVSNAMISYCR